MNQIDDIICWILGWIDLPIMVVVLGGFVLSAAIGFLALMPWFRGLPGRIWLAVSGILPTCMIFCIPCLAQIAEVKAGASATAD